MYLLLKNSQWHYGIVNSTAIVTARKRSLGQGNMFTGVCLSTGGRVPDQVHPPGPGTPPGSRQAPPEEQTPWTRYTPPGADTPPQEQTPPRSRHSPGADTPPGADPPQSRHPGRSRHPPCPQGEYLTRYPRDQVHPPGADTPPEQTHPQGPGTPLRADTPLGEDTPLVKCMLGDTVNARAVCILLECNLVTICEQSCGKVMLSVMCVCQSACSQVRRVGVPCDHYPWCIGHWTSLCSS